MQTTTSLTPISIGDISGLRQAMISASKRDAGGRTEAIKAILTAAVDAETKLHAVGLTPAQLPGARNVTVYNLNEPSDDTRAIHHLAITAERFADGWYVVDIRRNLFWRSDTPVIITQHQQDLITKIAAEKALVGFRVVPQAPAPVLDIVRPEREAVSPPPLDIAAARQTPPPFLRPKPKPEVKPEPKAVIVEDEDVLREAKPGAPDEQVSGYRKKNGTIVAAHKRGPKKHRRKAEQKEKVAA